MIRRSAVSEAAQASRPMGGRRGFRPAFVHSGRIHHAHLGRGELKYETKNKKRERENYGRRRGCLKSPAPDLDA